MFQTVEQTAAVQTRELLYLFLSRLYILETDMEVVDAIRSITCSIKDENEWLREGLEQLQGISEQLVPEKLEQLAVDYAGLFLAAGRADGKAAFPYESVYTSRERLLMQEAQNQVKSCYRRHQLVQGFGFPAVPEDHIAMELYFMALLCRKEIQFMQEDNTAGLKENRMEQICFYQEHLNTWVPYFCEDIAKYAGTEFYRAVGLITRGFMQWEGTYGLQHLSK